MYNTHNSAQVPEQLVQGSYNTPTREEYLRQHPHPCQSNDPSCLSLPLSDNLDEHTLGLGNESLDAGKLELEWKERIRHYTWTFFTMTMVTGGIANVLYTVPYRFPGLDEIGVAFFLFNLVLFVLNIAMIALRFHNHPDTFRLSLLHPTERLFVPSAVVSFSAILINISQYGVHRTGPWLSSAVLVLFWLDAAMAFLASSGVYPPHGNNPS